MKQCLFGSTYGEKQ